MNICIKYCGGCNPKYDRKKIIDYLKRDFKEFNIITSLDNARCDFVVVISGCASRCLST
jgi:4-hydroxybutyrate CoA-transferase